ncbi:MAG: hypothetical protein M3Y72_11775 [Acidobacteriota bacterium]|nr:hypothetical protein [Acidobacteriota bacterium]
MRLQILAILSLTVFAALVVSNAGLGQQARIPPAEAKGFDSITEADFKANLRFVASDALQGRLSLQPGDDAAVEWIASEFAKAGLQPADAGSYFQPVPLIEYRADRDHSYVASKRGNSKSEWKFPAVLGGYPRDMDVTASLVFAGYGITAPELRYDDYQGIDVQGAVTLRHRRCRIELGVC